MSYYLSVENESQERLLVQNKTGVLGGDHFSSFFPVMENYCENGKSKEDDVHQWVTELQSKASFDLCKPILLISKCYYVGDWSEWDFREDDYDCYRKKFRAEGLTENQFKLALRNLRNLWISPQVLIEAFDSIVFALTKANMPHTWYYKGQETINEFNDLINTINRLTKFNQSHIRLRVY